MYGAGAVQVQRLCVADRIEWWAAEFHLQLQHAESRDPSKMIDEPKLRKDATQADGRWQLSEQGITSSYRQGLPLLLGGGPQKAQLGILNEAAGTRWR